jgi:hypothetical protein
MSTLPICAFPVQSNPAPSTWSIEQAARYMQCSTHLVLRLVRVGQIFGDCVIRTPGEPLAFHADRLRDFLSRQHDLARGK